MILSVVIPAYQAESTIGRQLEAIAGQAEEQSLPPGSWELIVADNGSTDGTVAVAREFDGRVPIKIVDASVRRGPSAARNVGARAAAGRVLVFTDADDVVMDGWFDQWLRWARSARSAISAGPLVRSATHQGCVVPRHMGLPYAQSSNLGITADLFASLGGFDEDRMTGEDVDLSWRAVGRGLAVGCVPAPLRVSSERRGLSLLRRYFEYGLADPGLHRDHRQLRPKRDGVRRVVRSYAGLVLRVPLLFLPGQREAWLHQVGRRTGRLVGSLKSRNVCL